MLFSLYFWILVVAILMINFSRSDCVPKTTGLTVVDGKNNDTKVKLRMDCLDGFDLKAKTWFIIGGLSLVYYIWTFRLTKHH